MIKTDIKNQKLAMLMVNKMNPSLKNKSLLHLYLNFTPNITLLGNLFDENQAIIEMYIENQIFCFNRDHKISLILHKLAHKHFYVESISINDCARIVAHANETDLFELQITLTTYSKNYISYKLLSCYDEISSSTVFNFNKGIESKCYVYKDHSSVQNYFENNEVIDTNIHKEYEFLRIKSIITYSQPQLQSIGDVREHMDFWSTFG